MRIAFTLGLLPLALLAGCQNDAQRLQAARTEALARCNDNPSIKAGMPGLDTGRFCTCLTDKVMAGRTVADLAKLDNDAEAQRLGMESSAQCIAEQAGAAPAAAATPATMQPAQNVAAETAEEAGDAVD